MIRLCVIQKYNQIFAGGHFGFMGVGQVGSWEKMFSKGLSYNHAKWHACTTICTKKSLREPTRFHSVQMHRLNTNF